MIAVTHSLFTPSETRQQVSDHWFATRDGDPLSFVIFQGHYSARKKRRTQMLRIVGPGERIVLLTGDGSALFVWRYEKEEYRPDDQTGVNCSVFKNDGRLLSSMLIREADALAESRWPGRRHFTFVKPDAVKSTNPGYCFLKAGWKHAGYTNGGLRILDLEEAA